MPTVVGVLVEYTRVVLPAILFNRVETYLKQLGYYKVVVCWCIVGCLGHYCPGVAQSLIRSWFV